MKGDVGVNELFAIVLAVAVISVLAIVLLPLMNDAEAAIKGCGTLKSWIQDLSAGAAQLC